MHNFCDNQSTYLQMLHEDRYHHIDEHKLGHEDKYDEVQWCNEGADATVADTVFSWIAVLSQRVLHNAVPVVTRSNAEQSQEGHAKVAKVSVTTQPDTGMLGGTFWKRSAGNDFSFFLSLGIAG